MVQHNSRQLDLFGPGLLQFTTLEAQNYNSRKFNVFCGREGRGGGADTERC